MLCVAAHDEGAVKVVERASVVVGWRSAIVWVGRAREERSSVAAEALCLFRGSSNIRCSKQGLPESLPGCRKAFLGMPNTLK